MKEIKFCALILLLALSTQGFSAGISFKSAEYGGRYFQFYTIPNFLTGQKLTVCSDFTSDDGQFSAPLTISSTSAVFVNVGAYQGWFIAEPGKSYELVMPPYKERDTSNPHSKPELHALGVKDAAPDDINVMLWKFENEYEKLWEKHSQQILIRQSNQYADTLIQTLERQFPDTENKYYNQHKKYCYASVRFKANIKEPEVVISDFFNQQPVLYNHKEYGQIFNQLFDRYLHNKAQEIHGDVVRDMLNSGDIEQLLDWFQFDMDIDKTLAEAITLRGIRWCYVSKKYDNLGLFNILQDLSEKSEIPLHRTTANVIFKALSKRAYGTMAPELALQNEAGELKTWGDFEDKYRYLCITTPDNIYFDGHFQLLKELNDDYADDLEIVVVLDSDNFASDAATLNTNGVVWSLLKGEQETFEAFNVKMYPAYYLIDPDGRMISSPAPWPDESFSQRFEYYLDQAK